MPASPGHSISALHTRSGGLSISPPPPLPSSRCTRSLRTASSSLKCLGSTSSTTAKKALNSRSSGYNPHPCRNPSMFPRTSPRAPSHPCAPGRASSSSVVVESMDGGNNLVRYIYPSGPAPSTLVVGDRVVGLLEVGEARVQYNERVFALPVELLDGGVGALQTYCRWWIAWGGSRTVLPLLLL